MRSIKEHNQPTVLEILRDKMLDRIKSIKGLAVYEDYVSPSGMIDFKEKT